MAKNELQKLIESDGMRNRIASIVPEHLSPERVVRITLLAMNKTPALLNCTRDSVLQSMLDCSSLGLEPDGRNAHLIPYGKECKLLIDWKGLVSLAKRSGEVRVWTAEIVCENDLFAWRNQQIDHEIDFFSDRGRVVGVYSWMKNKHGDIDIEVMPIEEVEKIRDRSPAGKSGPWQTDFSEMAKKTVIRRHSKRLTLSPEFHDALEKDPDNLPDLNRAPDARKELESKKGSNPFADAFGIEQEEVEA